jgi:hypothetical protein
MLAVAGFLKKSRHGLLGSRYRSAVRTWAVQWYRSWLEGCCEHQGQDRQMGVAGRLGHRKCELASRLAPSLGRLRIARRGMRI